MKAPQLPAKLISKYGMKKAWAKFKRTRQWKAYARAKGKAVTAALLR